MGWGSLVKRDVTNSVRTEDEAAITCRAETKEELFEEVHEKIIEQADSGIVNLKVVNETITDIDGLFAECSSLKSVVLKEWHIPEVRSMRALFDGCENLESVRFAACDFSQVKDMRDMFSRCENLKSVVGLVVSDDTDTEGMYDGCPFKC